VQRKEVVTLRDPYGPPTPRQVTLARELDIKFDETRVTKIGLSGLIDRTLREALPSEEMKTFAKSLDIKFDETTTRQTLAALMDERLRERSIAALQANPTLRAGKVIIHKDVPYAILEIGHLYKKWCAVLIRVFSGETPKRLQVHIVTIESAQEITREELLEMRRRYGDPEYKLI
jgi:hypothetical protein